MRTTYTYQDVEKMQALQAKGLSKLEIAESLGFNQGIVKSYLSSKRVRVTVENLKDEKWKNVIGYEGRYMVSNLGRVKSITNPFKEELMALKMDRGYMRLNLKLNKTVFYTSVHRIMALAFLPNPENKATVNHKNGIKSDNRLENLEWNTASENRQHVFDVLKYLGAGAKLKKEQILEIRGDITSTRSELVKKYNISDSGISKIKLNQSYKNI